MQEKHLYEYAVIRIVPRLEREEFVNIGLILMCKRERWLRCAVSPDTSRVKAIAPDTDSDAAIAQLEIFNMVTAGCGAFAHMPVEERFRWLTAEKSTCVQTSRPHPGLTENLDATFDCLYRELVE